MAVIATRRERVVLDLETNFPMEAAKAAAAIRLLNEEVNRLGGRGSTGTPLKTAGRDIEDVGRKADRAAPAIDRYSGRMSLLVQSAAALGPALVPIGAVAIPAVTGLASSMGFAAIAGGTMIGAVQGVGDALKALNKAHLQPTAENIDAARLAMAQISPEARRFTRELQSLEPALTGLRDIAATNMFPGLIQGMEQMKTALPAIQRIVGAVSGELGTLAAEGGKSLAGPRWSAFFAFLANEAPQALADMAHGVGNVAHAMASLWMAFAPVDRSFSSWLLDSTASLDKWATGLSKTRGFADFIDYIQTAGPQVGATIGAIANALLQIVEAAAPIGGPVLHVIEALANAIAAIANSDIGTPLFGMIAALSALNLAMKAGQSIQGRFAQSQMQIATGFQKQTGRISALSAEWRAFNEVASFKRSGSALGGAGSVAAFVSPATIAQAERFKTSLRSIAMEAGKAGALVGAFALESSGAADKIGLTNTISLGLVGTMAGPYGAALGTAAGVTLDMVHANDELNSALTDAQRAMDSGSVDKMAAAYEKLNAAIQKTPGATDNFGSMLKSSLTKPGFAVESAFNLFSGKTGAAEAQLANLGKAAKGSTGGVDGLLHAIGALPPKYTLASLAALAASKALRANREAARATARSFVGLGDALNKPKVSLNAWIHDMEKSASALRQFTANSLIAANRGLRQGLIAALQKAGAEGALRMKQLANGTDAQIRRANRAWGSGRSAVKNYTDAIGGVPKSKSTKVSAPGTPQARAQIKAMRDEIGRLKDKSVHLDAKGAAEARAKIAALRAAIAALRDKTVTVHYAQTGTPNRRIVASGGPIRASFPGETTGPRDDTIPAMLSHREYVQPVSAVDYYGERFMEDVRTRRFPAPEGYAGGGLVDPLNYLRGGGHPHHVGAHHKVKATKSQSLQHAIDKLTAAVETDTAARDDLVSKRNDLASTVGGNFTGDPFGSSNVWAAGGGAGGVLGNLRGDIAKAKAFQGVLAQLRKNGVSGQALAAIASTGDVGKAQGLLSLGVAGDKQYTSLYNQRAAAANAVGMYAGNSVYGAGIAADNRQIAILTAEVRKLTAEQKRAHKNAPKHAQATGKAAGEAVRHKAGKSRRHK